MPQLPNDFEDAVLYINAGGSGKAIVLGRYERDGEHFVDMLSEDGVYSMPSAHLFESINDVPDELEDENYLFVSISDYNLPNRIAFAIESPITSFYAYEEVHILSYNPVQIILDLIKLHGTALPACYIAEDDDLADIEYESNTLWCIRSESGDIEIQYHGDGLYIVHVVEAAFNDEYRDFQYHAHYMNRARIVRAYLAKKYEEENQ